MTQTGVGNCCKKVEVLNHLLLITSLFNPLAAMAYQFPCAEPIYCNFMYFADKNSYNRPI